MRPLFERYRQLSTKLAHLSICDLPTPIQPLRHLGQATGHPSLYIKRDDLSGRLFGGNKVRTLEFLLAAAFKDGGNIVAGLAGTSMALASNVYAHALNVPLKTLLIRQEPTMEAQQNLRYFHHLGADLEQIDSVAQMEVALARVARDNIERYQRPPFWLNPSQPLGMCGYVNAALELGQQIEDGVMPEPDDLYLPVGLLGTITGLMLGLKAAGMKTQVVGVLAEPADEKQRQDKKGQVVALFNAARDFLRGNDPTFPAVELAESEFQLQSQTPADAGDLMDEALTWQQRWPDLEGIWLDATWTAPTVASLARDVRMRRLEGQVVLYWHTFNSRPYPKQVAEVDYTRLPPEFQAYFEADELAAVNKPAH